MIDIKIIDKIREAKLNPYANFIAHAIAFAEEYERETGTRMTLDKFLELAKEGKLPPLK